MKRFIFLSLFSLGLVLCSACNSCKKNDTTPPPSVCDGSSCELPPPTKPQDQKLSGEGWSMSVPAGWGKENLSPETMAHVEFIMSNKDKHGIILLIKEPFTGTLDGFALAYLRDIQDHGNSPSSFKQTLLNSEKFVLVTVPVNGNTVGSWLGVKGGFGYTFSCGGASSEAWHTEDCAAIASTLVLQ